MDPSASQAEIADFFGSIGRIKPDRRTGDPRIWMYKDKMSGRNKGECTVTYEDVEAAKSAIDWFNGKDFRGYTIKVSVAERRTATDRSQGTPRGRGGFGGRGRGRGGPPGGQEGDWPCPSSDCGNVNFAWRNECNRCQTPISGGGGGGGGYRGRGGGGGYRGGGGGGGGGPMRDYGGRGGGRDRPY